MNIKTFIKTCPNWQLRLVALVVIVLAGLLTSIVWMPLASFLFFFAAYACLVAADFREIVLTGPDLFEVMAADINSRMEMAMSMAKIAAGPNPKK